MIVAHFAFVISQRIIGVIGGWSPTSEPELAMSQKTTNIIVTVTSPLSTYEGPTYM